MLRISTLLSIAVIAVQIAASQREPLGLVEGIVVRWGTDEPLSDVDVELARLEGTTAYPLAPPTYPPGEFSPGAVVRATYPNPSDLRHTRTNTNGRFSFPNLPPGTYRLLAARAGGAYDPAEYGQHHPRGRGSNFQLTDGEVRRDIRLEMALNGSISGKVLKADGTPAARVLVMAFEASYQSGRRLLGLLQSAVTDDRGEYRLYFLPPGRYYIGARAEDPRRRTLTFRRYGQEPGRETFPEAPVIFRTTDAGEVLEETYATVYYGGNTDPATAPPIAVDSGASISGMDILLTLAQPRAFHIRGVVVNTAGEPVSQANVQAIPRLWSASLVAPATRSRADGSFDIRGIPAGAYYIRGNANIGGVNTGSIIPIEVRTGDAEGLQLVLNSGAAISGKIVFEGRMSGNLPDAAGLRIRMVPENPAMPGATATPSMSSFTISNIQPGDYRVRVDPIFSINTSPPYLAPTAVPPALQNAYLKSIRMGGEDILEDGIHLQDGQAPGEMEIVIGVNGGVLQGVVMDQRQQALPNAVVAVIPAPNLRRRTDLYRSTTTSATGTFRIAGLAPGEYRVFAWEYVEEGIWHDPEFVQSAETRGKPVRISEGATESIELAVLPEPR